MVMKNKKDQVDLFPKPAPLKGVPKLYEIPAGKVSTRCTAHKKGGTCAAEVYWISYDRPAKGGMVKVNNPIDCNVPGGFPPTATQTGRGQSHYETCPDVKLFHR